MDKDRVLRIFEAAEKEGRGVLLEPEGLEVLRALGIPTFDYVLGRDVKEARALKLGRWPGKKAVVKVVSPEILHKTDEGGVAFVQKSPAAVAAAIAKMHRKLGKRDMRGYLVCRCVPFDRALGSELLLGTRWTRDFGPVVTFGSGGIHTEFLAKNLRPERSLAIFAAQGTARRELERGIRRTAVGALLAEPQRGQKPRLPLALLADAVGKMAELGRLLAPRWRVEFEINPLVVSGGGLVALDALAKFEPQSEPLRPERPIAKIRNLLEARSAAVIGVSERMNTGHVIVCNMLRQGFDPARLFVVKPGSERIEGCRCVPELAALPEKVDLLVMSVPAAQVSELAAQAIELEKTESIIIIPGGLEEKSGGAGIVSRMHAALAAARRGPARGPVINGGNCLGIASVPGRYNTIFIPDYKMFGEHSGRCGGQGAAVPGAAPSSARGGGGRFAFLSQSGAFAVAKMSKFAGFLPKYAVSIGNQTDLTVGDYLAYLKDDPEVDLFAVYVEGFQPLDGVRFLESVREITASGRTVLFYRAGRTSEGKRLSASHTAAVAGDFAVTRALAEAAGALVTEDLADFEDLVRLFLLLHDKTVKGPRLGAVSNAGFECVAIADNLGALKLADFQKGTMRRITEVFARCRIDAIVDVHNPVDLTPMADDAAFADVVRAVLEDGGVDAGVIGCVPLTPALNTLVPGAGHREDFLREDSIVSRLIRLRGETSKPWVVIVDAGDIYDPMARHLERHGVPVFRSQDRALRLFGAFCARRGAVTT